MNNAATLEKLHLLKLYGMERAFRAILESSQDRVALVRRTCRARHRRRVGRSPQPQDAPAHQGRRLQDPGGLSRDRLLHRAGTRADYLHAPVGLSWITAGKTVIISGPTGVGKSYLSQALGSQACTLGHRTLYFNCSKLFQTLKEKRSSGGYQRFVGRIARTPLLILDDFGLVSLDAQDRLSLLEIVEDRLGLNATVIATQIPVAQWFDVIGDPTIADAVCDRIVPQAIRIPLSGMSMRALQGQREQSEACAIPAT